MTLHLKLWTKTTVVYMHCLYIMDSETLFYTINHSAFWLLELMIVF